ncbi:M56 family metallopeptidase [Flavobacterium sp.]|uniref:M56 family metallopeptidase n=1 Tax=Flavobacterium sp. TaxID=239 RepID=UPI002FDD4998
MEALFLYLLKSSGLIALFYIAYYFLVQKETFFNSNRWFLITGLFTSLLLPLFSFTKIVYVERPKIRLEDLVAYANDTNATPKITAVEAFDWMQLVWVSYIIIALLLLSKIVISLVSLFQMLYQQQKVKNENFTLVDLNHDIAPFSFFNYIVFNSSLYTPEELQSILLHEKVHSSEKHSIDMMIAKLFCILFWFNPFVWLYKKAIMQNLEFIADHKAMHQLEDPKVYQRALLKAVTHQNCLSITNNFYQSLIKKRIVMLNTHPSRRSNSWKYTLVVPALIGFVLLFQIKTVAQEKETEIELGKALQHREEVRLVINKNSTEAELKKEAKRLKENHGITLKCSKIKRNADGEITAIKVEFKDKNGNKGVSHVAGNEPIAPIHFYKKGDAVGFGKPKNNVKVYANVPGVKINEGDVYAFNFNDSVPGIKDFNFDFDVEIPEMPEIPNMPEDLGHMTWQDGTASKIIIKKGDKKPMVIVNGKVLSDEIEIEKALKEGNGQCSIVIDSDTNGKDKKVIINGKDMLAIRAEAMESAKAQMKKMKPIMKEQIKIANGDWKRVKEELERARPEMEKTKVELEKTKAELLKTRDEVEKVKAEIEKAKTELQKKK